MNSRALGALALAAMVSACATEQVRRPDVALPPAFETPVGAGGASQELDRWWRLYDDAQLTSLVEDALAKAPDARIGRLGQGVFDE